MCEPGTELGWEVNGDCYSPKFPCNHLTHSSNWSWLGVV